MAYIAFLEDLLEVDENPLTYVNRSLHPGTPPQKVLRWATSDMVSRLLWLNWEKLGIIA
ncbi:unnamed protein product [Soboliphyme baturini]|uniref:Transposase n=1 Tax=Soboliphyme baturini TaxID=241478 RepID=A0A183I9T4_9BILA|nr:unnamed protein product [Soboliphyme baturini]